MIVWFEIGEATILWLLEPFLKEWHGLDDNIRRLSELLKSGTLEQKAQDYFDEQLNDCLLIRKEIADIIAILARARLGNQ